jgi:hypothetical protein
MFQPGSNVMRHGTGIRDEEGGATVRRRWYYLPLSSNYPPLESRLAIKSK